MKKQTKQYPCLRMRKTKKGWWVLLKSDKEVIEGDTNYAVGVNLKTVFFIEFKDGKLHFICKDKKTYSVKIGITDAWFILRAVPFLCRVHTSFIINADEVIDRNPSNGSFIMDCEREVPFSDKYKHAYDNLFTPVYSLRLAQPQFNFGKTKVIKLSKKNEEAKRGRVVLA